MLFFLVTQTSLVEAQDEQEAAQTGVDHLRYGGQVTVSVKSNERTIRTSLSPHALRSLYQARRPRSMNHRLLLLLSSKFLLPH
ncbi:hypothetical protein [Rhizobium sp. NFACC06-2]|uniref:hypothetical protein n=1 Tax=Rhizobium sp. NFACC06-2 TaxID=1566264 RepID=UPI00122C7EFF|nr:hypothetical protein [Rhizobium sp. NFACC06-2]